MHRSVICAFGLCGKNRSSVWLTFAVIVTKAEQTKKRTSWKQTIHGKGHHCWHYRNDRNLQNGKIEDRKRNSRIITGVKSCLANSSGQVLRLKKAGLAGVRSLFSLLSPWYRASQTGLIGKHEVLRTGS